MVAVRYSEDVGGGMPKNMPGQMRQWWRLKQAWGLLEEYEAQCKHTYYWVFKIRTDAIVLGGGDLHTPTPTLTLTPTPTLTLTLTPSPPLSPSP